MIKIVVFYKIEKFNIYQTIIFLFLLILYVFKMLTNCVYLPLYLKFIIYFIKINCFLLLKLKNKNTEQYLCQNFE